MEKIAFYLNETLTYSVIYDKEETDAAIYVKLEQIAKKFDEFYGNFITSFEGDNSIFAGFTDLLLKLNFIQTNCGDKEECKNCANSTNNLGMQEFIELRKKKS